MPAQNCTETPSSYYAAILKEKMAKTDSSLAVGGIVFAAQAIVQRAAKDVSPASHPQPNRPPCWLCSACHALGPAAVAAPRL